MGYEELSRGAAEVPPGSRGVTFLPYLTGGYGDMMDASGAFLNMTLDTDRSALWRSVLEAIGYDYMGVTDEYREAGVDLSRITITEGGSADGGAVMTDCAMGAFAVGDERDLLSVLEKSAEVDRTFHPDEANTGLYRRFYTERMSVVKGMKDVFGTLKAMGGLR